MNDSDNLKGIINIDRLIHEPARLMILTILFALESADFIYLLGETGLGKGNLSSHLSRLDEVGYITIKKSFRGKTPMTVCLITTKGEKAFEVYREQLKGIVGEMYK